MLVGEALRDIPKTAAKETTSVRISDGHSFNFFL